MNKFLNIVLFLIIIPVLTMGGQINLDSATINGVLPSANGGVQYGVDSGSTDSYVVTLNPTPTSLVTGAIYTFKANTANTGSATINFNSLGAKTIKKPVSSITTDLDTGDIRAGQIVIVQYDGTNMVMQSRSGIISISSVSGTTNEISISGTTDLVVSLASSLSFSGKTISGGTFSSGAFNGTIGATTPSSGSFTTISTSGTLTVSTGSVSAPAISPSGDSNTGIYFSLADTIDFSIGGVKRWSIDSNGTLQGGSSSLQLSGNMLGYYFFARGGDYRMGASDDCIYTRDAAGQVAFTGAAAAAASLRVSGIRHGIVSKTTAYTATNTDFTILCDATSASFTVTLPASSANTGRIFVIKKIDSSVNTITIDGNASETIDGSLTLVISTQNDAKMIQCNGSNWFVIP